MDMKGTKYERKTYNKNVKHHSDSALSTYTYSTLTIGMSILDVVMIITGVWKIAKNILFGVRW